MKKIFAILISLLFVASVFGVASIMAGCPYDMTASKNSISVGESVTIYAINVSPCFDPYIQGACVQKISGPTATDEVIGGITYHSKWVYKACSSGDVKFSMCSDFGKYVKVSVKESHPMFSFMNILGFGKKK